MNTTITGKIKLKTAKKIRLLVRTESGTYESNYRDIENKIYSINLGDNDLLTQDGYFKEAQIELMVFDINNRRLSSLMFAISNKKSVIVADIKLKGL